ncbi:unnamed protein product [Blepharisma stoltei]|uniref:Uncharacterized protein n=1 Tax=Blepharisma stoltei TaxID=1481888 RepID=A0AAU9K3K8_9CILI|nr:unnamed protein product [Blepharisma stoltei]
MVRLLKVGKGKDSALHSPTSKEAVDFDMQVEYPVTSPEQDIEFEKINTYLNEKGIPELFNKLLTQVIHDKPENVKSHILQQLTKLRYFREHPNMQEPRYFTNEEFETMFEAYDIAGENSLPYQCLVQALTISGIVNPEEALREDFPELTEELKVSRPKFVQVMMQEFIKRGFSY